MNELPNQIVQKVDTLTRLVYASIRAQAMTMRLIIDANKDMRPDDKKSLLEAITALETVVSERQ